MYATIYNGSTMRTEGTSREVGSQHIRPLSMTKASALIGAIKTTAAPGVMIDTDKHATSRNLRIGARPDVRGMNALG